MSGVLQSSGDVRLRPVPGGVPVAATEQCTLVFRRELVLYKPSMLGSGPEGGCTVTLHDMADEHFFDSDLVVLSGSASDDFNNVVPKKTIQKKEKKTSSTDPKHTQKARCF